MALVQGPLHSEQATASAGKITFAVNKGSQTARLKSQPTQPETAAQLLVRAAQSTVSRAWQVITAAQMAEWEVYAAAHPETNILGDVKMLSGFNEYCRFNARLSQMGKSLITTPPIAAGPASPAAGAATGGGGQISFAWTAYGGTATMVEIWLIGPMSKGIKPDFRKATLKFRQAAETSPKVITGLGAGYYNAWLRAVSETDGQVSTYVLVTATVT